jgi:hypothetical protein
MLIAGNLDFHWKHSFCLHFDTVTMSNHVTSRPFNFAAFRDHFDCILQRGMQLNSYKPENVKAMTLVSFCLLCPPQVNLNYLVFSTKTHYAFIIAFSPARSLSYLKPVIFTKANSTMQREIQIKTQKCLFWNWFTVFINRNCFSSLTGRFWRHASGAKAMFHGSLWRQPRREDRYQRGECLNDYTFCPSYAHVTNLIHLCKSHELALLCNPRLRQNARLSIVHI